LADRVSYRLIAVSHHHKATFSAWFVRAVLCCSQVQTKIASLVSLLVVYYLPIAYRFRSVLFGSKLQKSAVRGRFNFASVALIGF
jgi:hypothetical protein